MRRRGIGRGRGGKASRVLAVKNITRAVLAQGQLEVELAGPPVNDKRPVTRGDCVTLDRPCPYVGCEHHLYLDVDPDTGSIKFNFPDLEPWELQHTCALDVADMGGITLEEVGEYTNLTRERIRQLEVRGLLKLKVSRTFSDDGGGE